MDRVIFHIDVNSAFLSWSAVKRLKEDPGALDLRTVPSAVGGDVKTRHGVITAKSIPAKRFGVKTGEPVMTALRKCPELILVPSDFKTYREYSRAFIEILKTYSPVLEQVSIDEAFLDMTGLLDGRPEATAKQIRDEIRTKLSFTVNVGISSNKLLAKMASDFEKPDKTHTLWPSEVPEKMWPLPVGQLFGCGGATAERLAGFGIRTIGDAAGTDPKILKSILGDRAGAYILRSANGISTSPVHTEHADAKSYSNERTMSEDITELNYEQKAPEILSGLSESVSRRMKRDGVKAQTVGVIVKTGEFRRHTRQMTLARPTNDEAVLLSTSEELMHALLFGPGGLFAEGQVLRLVGVSAANLTAGTYEQMSLFDWAAEREAAEAERAAAEAERAAREAAEERQKKRSARLDEMMKHIRTRFGEGAVTRGAEQDGEKRK